MINNRQAGRRRGRGGNGNNNPRQGGGGGGNGRADNGNRIDNRARGNANQLYEKYKNLAADSQRQGDRVNTEYYLQFADHYFRVLSDQRGRFEDQPQRRSPQEFDTDDGEDFGDEGEPIRAGEQDGRPERQDRNDRQDRGDRPERAERQNRDDRADRQDQPRQRDARPRNEARGEARGETRNDARGDTRADGERPRRWDREDRGARAEDIEVAGQRRSDPPMAGENLERRAEAVIEADAPLAVEAAPRRRGRPRRDAAAVVASPVEADEAHGVDADRLPPSLGIAAANDPADDGEEAPKPRRRRVRAAAATEVAE